MLEKDAERRLYLDSLKLAAIRFIQIEKVYQNLQLELAMYLKKILFQLLYDPVFTFLVTVNIEKLKELKIKRIKVHHDEIWLPAPSSF